jgi:peptide/nickel transport system permease protein
MLGFIIQRILQAALVMLAMSALVFVGVYAIGNPIDVIISPDATQDIRAQTIARYGLDRPLWEQYFVFVGNLLRERFRRSFLFGMPVIDLILSRLPATLELTLIAVFRGHAHWRPARLSMRATGPTARPQKAIMTLSIFGLLGADVLDRAHPHSHLRGTTRLAAGGKPGPTRELFGIQWSFLTLEGWKHLALPALNLSLFKFAMMIRLARAGHPRVMLTDTVKFARAAGSRRARSCAGTC